MSYPRHKTTRDEASKVGAALLVDWAKIDVDQLRRGMDVEFEHGAHDPQTDVTHDDPLLTGQIALAHLKEFPDYYDRLARMEEDAKRDVRNEDLVKRERWAACSGFVAIGLGIAAAALERPWPSDDPAAFATFIAQNRSAILAQSMLFIMGSAFFMWFLGSLRSYLVRGEAGTARLSHIAFGAGGLWVAFNILGQAPQIALALPMRATLEPAIALVLANLCFVVLNLANLPLAVMLWATAAVSFRSSIFPRWLAWLAVVAAAAALVLSFAVVHPSGPLAPQGWLTLVLYPVPVLWLLPATVVMIRRMGTLSST